MITNKLVPKLRFGEFDENWKKSNLGEISSNEMYGMNSASKEYDGVNKYIRITDISESSNKFAPNPLTSPDGDLEDKYKLQEGDIVFARTGASTGKTYLYDKKDGKLYFAGFLIKFHIDKAVPKFIFYNTLKEDYLNWVSIMSVRSGQPGINSNEYKKLPIYLPSSDEQNKISEFLQNIDKKIELLENKYESYDDFKKYLMQQFFTQNINIEDSSNEYIEYNLGDLVVNVIAGATPKTSIDKYWNNGNIPWLSSGEVHKKVIHETDKFITAEGYANSSTKLVPKNSVLIALAGQGKTRGTVAINKIELCTNQSIATIIPNKLLYYKYLFYYLESKYDYLRALSSSDGGRGGLNLKLIKSIPIIIPPIKEQEKIANTLSISYNKLKLIENQIFTMKKFKRSLLQQMFI